MLFFFLVMKKAGYNFSMFKILSETVQLEHTSDNMIDVKQQNTTTGNASFSTLSPIVFTSFTALQTNATEAEKKLNRLFSGSWQGRKSRDDTTR